MRNLNVAIWSILCVIPVIALILWLGFKDVIRNKVKASNISYHGGNTVKILRRNKSNRKVFYAERAHEINYNYHPASATFTAATVGGVTTGGWDYQEEHYSTELGKKTDRYQLWYRAGDGRKDDALITAIALTPEDARQVQSNSILSQFLKKGNILKLEHPVVSENVSGAKATYSRTGDIYAAANMLSADAAKRHLLEHEINAVIDFICGE